VNVERLIPNASAACERVYASRSTNGASRTTTSASGDRASAGAARTRATVDRRARVHHRLDLRLERVVDGSG
jgi:hypothetical protein